MKGFIHYKSTFTLLIWISSILLNGCSSTPQEMSFNIPSALNPPSDEAMQVPRKLNFVFEYKQVTLTDGQRKRLLYLYDWQHGANISYGKAKAANDYIALSIGHQRVQAVIEALANNEVVNISYDPALAIDSVLIEENIVQITDKPAGLLDSSRL